MKDTESCVQKSMDRFFEVRSEKMERNKKGWAMQRGVASAHEEKLNGAPRKFQLKLTAHQATPDARSSRDRIERETSPGRGCRNPPAPTPWGIHSTARHPAPPKSQGKGRRTRRANQNPEPQRAVQAKTKDQHSTIHGVSQGGHTRMWSEIRLGGLRASQNPAPTPSPRKHTSTSPHKRRTRRIWEQDAEDARRHSAQKRNHPTAEGNGVYPTTRIQHAPHGDAHTHPCLRPMRTAGLKSMRRPRASPILPNASSLRLSERDPNKSTESQISGLRMHEANEK
ncbi:hypothetical protein K438DRAFT_1762206 [Mycena galopus ATCC 62051]|nr:hypothetical protein K438DRAFT_1762206 [Mycena galopus ATCC 62051]